MDFRGKQIIVTGGVKGLGRALVYKFLDLESLVTVIDVDNAGLAGLKKDYPALQCLACDVSNHDQVSVVAEKFFADRGAPDVLINNAGILYSEPLVKIAGDGLQQHDPEAWDRVLRTNLSSVFYVTSCFVAKMIAKRTKGVVVNIGSISSAGNPGASAYSAAKAGVHALTAAWAKELGPMGIRVIAIAPGFIDTESAHTTTSEVVLQETIKRVPLKRLGKIEEVVDAVLSVIENGYFNGKVFELDGGLVI